MTAGVLAQVTGEATPVAEFWVFVVVGAVCLGSAIAVVLMRNAVHAALMLVINFFTIAIFYAVLEAQFLAVVQIIVYAGAIMVLFLFVIMLVGVASGEGGPPGTGAGARGAAWTVRLRGHRTAAVVVGVVLFVALAASVAAPWIGDRSVCGVGVAPGEAGTGLPCVGLAEANADGNVQGLGRLLFTTYVWPFEVASVLLVIAAVGAIILGRRRERPEELVDQSEPSSPPDEGAEDADTAPDDADAPAGTLPGGEER